MKSWMYAILVDTESYVTATLLAYGTSEEYVTHVLMSYTTSHQNIRFFFTCYTVFLFQWQMTLADFKWHTTIMTNRGMPLIIT